jgi:hypothetical protein
MNSLEALIESSRNSPDELYTNAFLYFQALFLRLTADASKLQLPSHLPESAYNDRQVLGLVITGALIAILDHRLNTGTAAPAEILVLVHMEIMPTHIREQLDDIILDQMGTLGGGIFASELAHSRWFEWERHDYSKVKRGLRALDKAARIHQRMRPTPLTDPFRHERKEQALTELGPVLKRMEEEFKSLRRQPTDDQILKAFEREASKPELSFLSNKHNLNLLLESLRTNPRSLLSWSAADVYDNFYAFITKHKSDYTRRRVSSRKVLSSRKVSPKT